ncbi:MAG: DUF4184 family protein [Polyangiaceae bacterium]
MPLTFPSHAAAILPLRHIPWVKQLSTPALVVGSTAPDLVYLFASKGASTHRPLGLLYFCLPIGLLAFLYVEALTLPVISPLVLPYFSEKWHPLAARLFGPRTLPSRFVDWLRVGAAIMIGAGTHQLWDGFTHEWMWPARVLYPGKLIGPAEHPMLLSKLLQHSSSLLGLAIVGLYLYLIRSRIERAPTSPAPLRKRALGHLLVLPLVAGACGAATALNAQRVWTQTLWDTAWAGTVWFCLMLGIVCLRKRLAPTSSL